ncbi:MAG: CoA pyrophosphatase [Caulobacterales bacterium]|nr:CoA pyrophosphatase [Caulobacterales bacterium]
MSLGTLKARLAERLRPVSDGTPESAPTRSDYDLNPDLRLGDRTLQPAAVLVPVMAHADGATVLLTRRADSLTSHTGQIAFPGGRLDPGETAVQAALREAWEEVALAPASVEVLGLGDAYETGSGFLVTPVVGWVTPPVALAPSPDEVAELFETPWDFLMDVANHRRDHLEMNGARRFYWAMPWNERYIWGVTAGLLKALHGRLYGVGDAAAEAEDAA